MKKNIILFILLWAIPASAAETFDFITHTRPPVSLFLREVLEEAFQPLHKEITLQELPGKRVIKMVNGGEADGDPSRVKNFKQISDDDASNYVIVDEPILHIEIVMVTHRETSIEEASWEAVNQGKAMFLRGSKRIRKNIDPENRVPVDSIENSLKMLALKRFPSLVMFRSEARSLLQNDSALEKDLMIHQPPLDGYNMYPYLHQKHSALVSELAQSLKSMKADGRFQQIVEKYFISIPVPGKD